MIGALYLGDVVLEGEALAGAIASHRLVSYEPRELVATASLDTVCRVFAALADRAPLVVYHPKRPALARPPANIAGAAVVLETSGTTAAPRWIAHRRGALLAHAGASVRALACTYDDTWLVALPLAHVAGLAPLLRAHVAGSNIALLDSFEPDRFIAAIEARQITLTSLVPTMLADLVATGWRPPPHLRAVLVGGAACPASLAERARDLGIPIVTTYGMTETFSHVALDGRLLDGVDARLDPRGRIELRTPAATTWPDWLTTGDVGRIEGRRITVFGRSDDIIVTGGENVSPARVEDALADDDAIASACVVGLPDPRWGQLVAAAITLRHDERATARIDADLRSRLASFERPRRYLVLDSLPLLPSGKPDRARVAAELMSSGTPPRD